MENPGIKNIPTTTTLEKTTMTWWRFGKEHEGSDPNPPCIRNNGTAMASEALDKRLERYRTESATDWRMWLVSPTLVIEKVEKNPLPSWAGDDTMFHYLLNEGIAIMENFYSRRYGRVHYIHICEYFFDDSRQSWIMKDLFTDILVTPEGQLVTVLDLDDLADAHSVGLVSANQVGDILRHTQRIIRLITEGNYPLPAMRLAYQAARRLGWRD